jgi:two-component system, NtrC family, sensor histidine kinase HydH
VTSPTPVRDRAHAPAPAAGRPLRRLRLQYRLVVPLILVALASTGAVTWVGVRATTSALQARLEAQLLGSASAVTWRDFALSAPILQNLRAVIGADIVTFGADRRVIASSFADPRNGVVDAARRTIASEGAPSLQPRVVSGDCGYPCVIAFRAVDGRPGVTVALVADASPVVAATRSVVRTILLSAALAVIVLILVSQAVVRRVTAPLERLVQFVRTLSAQNPDARAQVGDDEIGSLAEAFNGMLDRLDQSRAALVRSEKLGLAGLFAARVAHDIRNPLSSIKMQAQLLRSKLKGGTEDRDTLSAILHDIGQVESVVRDLMELANPGSLSLQPGSLNAVVRDALEQLAAQFTYRKIRVSVQLAEPLPPVRLDAPRLRQAILNVLVNGSEAMHTGGELQVASGAGEGRVWIRICDDGVGIDPALVDRVFDPFVSTKPEGVGLGLVNVKAVVEGHGGAIRLEPRQPRGTCAHLWLPDPNHG